MMVDCLKHSVRGFVLAFILFTALAYSVTEAETPIFQIEEPQ